MIGSKPPFTDRFGNPPVPAPLVNFFVWLVRGTPTIGRVLPLPFNLEPETDLARELEENRNPTRIGRREDKKRVLTLLDAVEAVQQTLESDLSRETTKRIGEILIGLTSRTSLAQQVTIACREKMIEFLLSQDSHREKETRTGYFRPGAGH